MEAVTEDQQLKCRVTDPSLNAYIYNTTPAVREDTKMVRTRGQNICCETSSPGNSRCYVHEVSATRWCEYELSKGDTNWQGNRQETAQGPNPHKEPRPLQSIERRNSLLQGEHTNSYPIEEAVSMYLKIGTHKHRHMCAHIHNTMTNKKRSHKFEREQGRVYRKFREKGEIIPL